MDKKAFIILGEGIAFVAGAALVSEFPTIGPFMVVLSLIIGFVGGFFIAKMPREETINYLRDQLNETRTDLNAALKDKLTKATEMKSLENDYYKVLNEAKALEEELKSLKQATEEVVEEKKEVATKKATKKKTK